MAALPNQDAEDARFERIRAQGSALVANVGAIEEVGGRRLPARRPQPGAARRDRGAATGACRCADPGHRRPAVLRHDGLSGTRRSTGLARGAHVGGGVQPLPPHGGTAGGRHDRDPAPGQRVRRLRHRPCWKPLRERFEASAGKIRRGLSALGTTPLHDRIAPALFRLLDMGLDRDQGFDLRASGTRPRRASGGTLLASNNDLALALAVEAEALVGAARGERARCGSGVVRGDPHRTQPAAGDQRRQHRRRGADLMALCRPRADAPSRAAL